MAYSPTYTETDLAPSIVDNLVKVVAGVGVFATLIGLLLGLAIGMFVFNKLRK
jgi:hypothetical protein